MLMPEVIIVESWREKTARSPALTRCRNDSSIRSEEHTSELQPPCNLVCRLLLEHKAQQWFGRRGRADLRRPRRRRLDPQRVEGLDHWRLLLGFGPVSHAHHLGRPEASLPDRLPA